MLLVSLMLAAAALASEPRPLDLPTSPFTSDRAADLDHDCIRDDLEHEIALHFRPYFVFDSRENARTAREPVGLYQVVNPRRSLLCDRLPETLEIRYAYLFAEDGGYVGSWVCGDRHAGDNQSVRVPVSVELGGLRFQVTGFGVGDGRDWPAHPIGWALGSHPIVFLSAGKHHPFTSTERDGRDSPYSSYGCNEAVDGRGAERLLQIESAAAPHGRHNVGEASRHPTEHFVGDLALFGYVDENAWDNRPFCGGGRGHSCEGTSTMSSHWVY